MPLKNLENEVPQKLGAITLRANIRAQGRPTRATMDADAPKSFSACRVHDPANFGSMPTMEFFNRILD
jgi:hypothetical protein